MELGSKPDKNVLVVRTQLIKETQGLVTLCTIQMLISISDSSGMEYSHLKAKNLL